MRAADPRPPRPAPPAVGRQAAGLLAALPGAGLVAALPAAGLLAVAMGASLAGCTGSLFQSKAPPSTTYLLSAEIRHAPERVGSNAPGAAVSGAATRLIAAGLAVQRPRVRTGLDTDRIAVLYPDRRLDYFADARWSGPLAEMVQDLALQAFHSGAHLGNVTDGTSALPTGYWLEIEVADFQAEYAAAGTPPTVHVRLLATLGATGLVATGLGATGGATGRGVTGDRRLLGTFDADIHETAADNRLSAIVESYERAAAAALAQIVSASAGVLEGTSNDVKPAASAGR